LRQRDRDSGVILEFATDSSEQASVRHNVLSPSRWLALSKIRPSAKV
jgi:hypothetical protein